jgi:murein DD-endopeptidase MepM/ murein hydrolase activator NlpD
MTFEKPLYLRGSAPPRRGNSGTALGIAFALVVIAVNYLVFFRGEEPSGPSLEQRLALPVEVLTPESLQGIVASSSPETPLPNRVEGALARGETAGQALARMGAMGSGVGNALEALSEHVNMRALRPGQRIVASILPNGDLHAVRMQTSELAFVEATMDESGWIARKDEVTTDKETIELACMIRGSLYESLERCGADVALAPVVAELLAGQVDFHTDCRNGDVLRAIVDRETLDGRFLRYGRIHGLVYEGRLVQGSAFAWVTPDDGVRYFDADGNSAERPFLRSPLKYTRVSSRYSDRRLHPILHKYTPHKAVDYAAPRGTPVHSIGEGKVIFAGAKGASGNLVVVQHDGGFQSYYAHLSRFARNLKVGDLVSRRTLVGTVGSTGRSTGPHLHFAIAKDGAFIHPRKLLDVRGDAITESDSTEFKADVGRLTGRLKALPVRGADATRS